MRRLFYSLTMFSMIGVLSLGFTGCTEDDDNPITPVDDVVAPQQLQAYSDDAAVGLSWAPSTSENNSNFGQYRIQVVEVAATDTSDFVVNAGNGAIINGLTNGIIYNFRVFAEDTDGKLSDNYSEIRWAPASRKYFDQDNNQIEVYATTSATEPSGIDIYNPATGKAEVISQAGAQFAQRGDLFVFAESGTSQSLVIRAPQTAQNNPGPTTFFSTVSAEDADNLNGVVQSSAPANSTYTKTDISIGDGPATVGKMYWGRIENRTIPGPVTGDFYFRMLVRAVDGKLVQGTGDDRYLILEFSYQTMPDVPYAKRVN